MRTLRNADRAGQGPPRLPVRRLARDRQDVDGEDPRRVPELRAAGRRSSPAACCESCVSIAERDVDGRHRDGRGLQQLGRRHPRAARVASRSRRSAAGYKVYILDEAHMLSTAGVERVPQDARGAAAAHDLRARHDRGAARSCRRSSTAATASTSRGRRSSSSRRSCCARRRQGGDRRSRPRRSRCSPATRPAPSATRSARSSSSSPTRARRSPSRTCSRCSASPTPSCCSARSTPSARATRAPRWLVAARLADTGRDAAQFLQRPRGPRPRRCSSCRRSARCPPSCAVTPERDARLAEQAARVGRRRRRAAARPARRRAAAGQGRRRRRGPSSSWRW